MKKSLTPRGNGWMLIIPKNIIKLAGIIPETSNIKLVIKNKIMYAQEISPEHPDCSKFLVRKLTRRGASWTLYMSNDILELLSINPEVDSVDIDIDDNLITIKKYR